MDGQPGRPKVQLLTRQRDTGHVGSWLTATKVALERPGRERREICDGGCAGSIS
jgi:hypothetical protein